MLPDQLPESGILFNFQIHGRITKKVIEEFYGSGIVKEEQIQMEIRLLYAKEIELAEQTPHEVYEQCVRPYTRNAAEVQQYYDYMNLPNLSQEMLA